jgi:hypothetical protein
MPLRLSQIVYKGFGSLNPFAEIVISGEADDCMAITASRHMVDQVNEAVFKTADRQTVNDVRDQWRRSFSTAVSHA